MPTTVQQLYNAFGIQKFNKVIWNTKFHDNNQGVYIVTSNSDFNNIQNNMSDFDDDVIKYWIEKLPYFTIDGEKPSVISIKNRLSEFWMDDEVILYIGKAPKRSNGSGISNRINEYYNTKIGNRSPHSGGQWLKVLKNINTFTVHFGYTENPKDVEKGMLDFFIKNVSINSLEKLRDKNLPLPFANLNHGKNKDDGFNKQRKEK